MNTFHIMCILFEKCNLNCDFCFENNKDKIIDYQFIESIPLGIQKIHKSRFPECGCCDITFMGGELFMDTLDDSIFMKYQILLNELRSYSKLTYNVNFLTNGVFNKRERVMDFIKNNNINISFSYDPVGRYPSDVQLNMFRTNISYFKDFISTVLITPTKQSIHAITSGNSLLSYISDNTRKLDLSFYIPGYTYKNLNPSDADLFVFFKYLIDHDYFEFKDIREILKPFMSNENDNIKIYPTCNCDRLITYSKRGITNICVNINSPLPIVRFYGRNSSIVNESNINTLRKQSGMSKRGCITCEYFNKCVKPCWSTIIFDDYELGSCPYQLLIEYIDANKNDIINRYGEWTKHAI